MRFRLHSHPPPTYTKTKPVDKHHRTQTEEDNTTQPPPPSRPPAWADGDQFPPYILRSTFKDRWRSSCSRCPFHPTSFRSARRLVPPRGHHTMCRLSPPRRLHPHQPPRPLMSIADPAFLRPESTTRKKTVASKRLKNTGVLTLSD